MKSIVFTSRNFSVLRLIKVSSCWSLPVHMAPESTDMTRGLNLLRDAMCSAVNVVLVSPQGLCK